MNASDECELKGHTPRCATPLHGRIALLFAVAFTLGGSPIVLVSLDVIHVSAGSIHGPRWILGLVGGLFTSVGLFCFANCIGDLRRAARLRKQQQLHFAEPWFVDFDWNPEGIHDGKIRKLVTSVVGTLFFGVFLLPFNWWAFFSRDGILIVRLMTGLFDTLFLLSVGATVYRFMQFLKYGRGYLRFARFPYLLGESLEVQYVNKRGLDRFEEMTLTLRYIEERYVTRGSGKNRSTSVVCFEQYRDTQTITGSEARFARSEPVSITFALPQGDYASCLRECPPKYWELEVTAKTPGVDLSSTFVLPVYQTAAGSPSHGATFREAALEPVGQV